MQKTGGSQNCQFLIISFDKDMHFLIHATITINE